MTPPADKLAQLLPRAGRLQLEAVLEEQQRRAKAGRRVPAEIPITLIMDEETGKVDEVEVPRRYGWTG